MTERPLTAEVSAVRHELTRVDAKCATLTSLAGVGLAFLVTQTGTREAWPVRVLLAAAGVSLTGAAVTLLIGVARPRLGTTGFCRWARMDAEQISAVLRLNEHGERWHAATELMVLSRIAHAKNRRLQRAVDLMVAGFVALAAALVAGVIA